MSKHYHLDYGVRETRKWRRLLFIPVSLGLVIYGSFVILSKSAPQTTVDVSKAALSQTTQTPSSAAQPKITVPISWPKYGYAAYSVPKDNIVVASINKPQRVPIASLAKVITVLAVLKESPLEPGQQGPMITLDEQDVALVSEYAQKSGSTVPVIAGEQISQYQMMQAILMPSSNNMSDSLVRWTFGSVDEYIVYANTMLKDLGLEETIVADDASGYSPNTVSSAEDLTELGFLYMQEPVLREIAMTKQATIPVAGTIYNANSFINTDGVVGIKIGNTDEAGKCFLAASVRQTSESTEEVSIAVVLGAQNFNTAAEDAGTILKAGNNGHDKLKKIL